MEDTTSNGVRFAPCAGGLPRDTHLVLNGSEHHHRSIRLVIKLRAVRPRIASCGDHASYRLAHLTKVGALRRAGLTLLPTATRPHFTLLSTGGGTLDLSRLLVLLGEPRPNPFHERQPERKGGGDER